MTDYSHLTEENYRNIEKWLQGDHVSLDKLNIRYMKPIWGYRGIKLIKKDNINRILNNKTFRLNQKLPIESWSKTKYIAAKFAIPSINKIGVVIMLKIRPQNIILDLTDEKLYTELYKRIDFIDTIQYLKMEQEIVIKSDPNRNYNLCDNIILLLVRTKNLNDSYKEDINNKLEKLEKWDHYRVAVFNCNIKGQLRLHGWSGNFL